jgi:glutathione S-transferase
MIKLHGVGLSNYYNMVKLSLTEKGVDFEEVEAAPSQEAAFKSKSPMGKVPCIETPDGFLSETTAIMGYLEALQPKPALLPSVPYQRGKVLELMKVMELYIELQARRHYNEIFFGGERNQAAFDEAKPIMENGMKALKQLGKFKPYVAGGDFTFADVFAAYTFCYAAPVAQAIYGWDIMSEAPGLQGAIDATNARKAGAKVAAAHGAALKAFQEQAA